MSSATNDSQASENPKLLDLLCNFSYPTVSTGLRMLKISLYDCIHPYIKRIHLSPGKTKQNKTKTNQTKPNKQKPQMCSKNHMPIAFHSSFSITSHIPVSHSKNTYLINHSINSTEPTSCGDIMQNPSSEGCCPIGWVLSPRTV